MPLLTKCTHCSTQAQVPDNAVGKRVRCPKCKKDFVVSGPAGAPARQPAAVAAGGGGGDNTVELVMGGAPAAAGGTPSTCPACKAQLLPGAVACMDCGYLIAGDTSPAQDEQVVVCTNPACGAANPLGERNCVRCSNPLPTPPGTLINNRYKIEKQLAVGGFGAVYLATDTKGGNKPVAVKDMLCEDPQEFNIRLNFFRREAEILRSLEKVPIVPRVFELIQEGQLAHLILEFIKGKDLLKIMEGSNNKPFPIPQVVEWGKSVCDVLTHMHTQTPPLIHRDLKPDNIMLLEDNRTIKMIDFGTARDMGRSQKSRLAAKTRVYTEGYAPPEQIIGKPEARSDLFALAGTLYHLATGKAPEGSFTQQEIDQQLKSNSLPREHHWFFELIKINLSEDINDRYFSAREIKQDLERKQVTTQVSCGKCKTVNKVREPYCSKCGEGLTDVASPCTQCGKSSRMGSRHCIHCGNRLR
ncbi:MAG: protein kinase [Gemmataceae bacterium]